MQNKDADALKKDIGMIKGVGEARKRLFSNMGIQTIGDLLFHFPRDYEDRRRMKKIINAVDGEYLLVEAVLCSQVSVRFARKGLDIEKAYIQDETGKAAVIWFNQPYLKNIIRTGERYVFYGRALVRPGVIELSSPEYIRPGSSAQARSTGILPIYPSTAGLTQNIFRGVIANALRMPGTYMTDPIPAMVRYKYALRDKSSAIKGIHFPISDQDLKISRKRLVFEELYLQQLVSLKVRQTVETRKKTYISRYCEQVHEFAKSLPFLLTEGQKKTFIEIERDMESEKPMNRLLQGDVGSGKTIVCLLAMLKAFFSGYQSVMMAPTEILAMQHYNTIKRLVKGTGIGVAVLKCGISGPSRDETLKGIENGDIGIIIGTHSLLNEEVRFKNLALVITDEQHRFGVRQRTLLTMKAASPDILAISATPIPRTLAMAVYGDLDVSVIGTMPQGRKPVKTFVVTEEMRSRTNDFIRRTVASGRQVYIVCPFVDNSSGDDIQSVIEMESKIREKDFPDLKVGLLHGRLKSNEKSRVLDDFAKGRVSILVCTSIIEVGMDMPNAGLIVVENAERYGLAQLHQLRGRVGRSDQQSYCILYNQGTSELSAKRMDVMQKNNDGFSIAEKDLELRGPGDFFGTRQHGIPDFKIANLYKDMDILKQAREAAQMTLENEKNIDKQESEILWSIIKEIYEEGMVPA